MDNSQYVSYPKVKHVSLAQDNVLGKCIWQNIILSQQKRKAVYLIETMRKYESLCCGDFVEPQCRLVNEHPFRFWLTKTKQWNITVRTFNASAERFMKCLVSDFYWQLLIAAEIMHFTGWEQICQWKSLARHLMNAPSFHIVMVYHVFKDHVQPIKSRPGSPLG